MINLKLLSSLFVVATSTIAHAASQQDVLRTISDNVGDGVPVGKLFGVVLAGIGVIVVIAIFAGRKAERPIVRAVNHQGKLLKEISRRAGIRPSEIRRVKTIAESQQIENPLVVLLCPSVIRRVKQSGKTLSATNK